MTVEVMVGFNSLTAHESPAQAVAQDFMQEFMKPRVNPNTVVHYRSCRMVYVAECASPGPPLDSSAEHLGGIALLVESPSSPSPV